MPKAPPSDDDGDVLLPESDSDGQDIAQLASASGQGPFKTPMKRMRSSPTQNQGLQPGPVARDPPPAVIDGQPGGLDLPEDVVNDDSELDDIFGDVATVSPDKRHRQCARGLQRKAKKQRRVKEYPGPSSSEVMASLIQREAPVVVPPLGLMLDGTLADDVMEIVFAPAHLGAHAEAWLARQPVGRLGDRLGLVSTRPPDEPARRDSPPAAENRVPGTPLHMVLPFAFLELETCTSAHTRASDGMCNPPLGVLLPDHAHPIACWPRVRP